MERTITTVFMIANLLLTASSATIPQDDTDTPGPVSYSVKSFASRHLD